MSYHRIFVNPVVPINCSYSEILAVSGAGLFTYDYAYPYLYVTDQGTSDDGILTIYDMANPASPALLSTTALPTDSGPREPRIYGDHLYIPYKAGHALAIWDVSDRSNPSLLGSVDLSGDSAGSTGPMGVAKIGDVAAVVTGVGFVVPTCRQIDVSDPSNPVTGGLVSPWAPGFSSSGWSILTLNDNFVFAGTVTGGQSQPYVCTVDPVSFTKLDTIGMGAAGGSPSLISTNGVNHVYLYNGNLDVVHAVDCSDPSNLSYTSSAGIVGLGSGAQHPTVVVPAIDRLYVGRAAGGGLAIYILDISDPDDPIEVGAISTSGETCTCMRALDVCAGFAWGQGTGAAIHLLGTAPLS